MILFQRKFPHVVLMLTLLLSGMRDVRAGTLVRFRTTVGDWDVELFDADKPVTVQNFIRYIQAGRYQDSIMHRAVTNFVIQGGGIYVANRGATNAGLVYIPTDAPITNEFKVGPFYSNGYGTIAMAKTSDPNSATSQFFFNLANNSAMLDNTNNSGGFTVFGRVLAGTNALNRLNPGPANTTINVANLGGVLAELPVLKPSPIGGVVYFTNLIYVDITLLDVQLSLRANGDREISWNSVSNRLNYVEYTTNFPPLWQLLVTTNAPGGNLRVLDTSSAKPSRFYRVRVDY
jgi:cyclophilin family peptidyl-prolyl cis-trans isomerase